MTLSPLRPSAPSAARFASFEEATFLGIPRLLEAAEVPLAAVDVPALAAELVQHRPARSLRDECWLLPELDRVAVRAAAARHGRPLRA